MRFEDSSSLADTLYRRLQDSIRSGELEPGSRLPSQKDLAENENVSRTVVREAVARLTAQGLAVSRQGSGVYVSETARYQAFQIMPDELEAIENVMELLELRLAVESEMASLAAGRRNYADIVKMRQCLQRMSDSADSEEAVKADVEFHVAIAEAARNKYYKRFLDFLGVRLVPSRSLYLKTRPQEEHEGYARQIASDHRAIFDAIVEQDPVKAREAARRHMHESLERHARLGAEQATEVQLAKAS